MKRIQIIGFLLWVFHTSTSGQSCPNVDFSYQNLTNWYCDSGFCCPIITNPSTPIPGRHTIIDIPGTDPNVGGALQTIPPGFSSSLQLGNANTGSEAEGVSYSITVSSSNALFIYKYAVVLQDPGHDSAAQPRFEMVVKDQFNNPINCTKYTVVAHANEPGFNTYYGPVGDVIWKDWTTVGVDLSAYIGQTVTIEARTGDCAYGGHYGYAYLVGKCSPLQINLLYCTGDTVATLTAPEGFASYNWSTGDTTSAINVDPSTAPPNITCTLTSGSGCQVVLNAPIINYQTTADFSYVVNCDGMVIFTDQSTSTNGTVNSWSWDFGDNDSTYSSNPVHQYDTTGTYNVQLIANAGCPDTIMIPVNINTFLDAGFTFYVDCHDNLFLTNTTNTNLGLPIFSWSFGDGDSSNSFNPTHQYDESGEYAVTLTVSASGCTSSATQMVNTGMFFYALFFGDSLVCMNSTEHFSNQSFFLGIPTPTAEWYVNHTLVSSNYSLDYTFQSDTADTLMLIITDISNCTDTFAQPIYVIPEIYPDFSVAQPCVSGVTEFNYTSTGYPGMVTNWVFGNGFSSGGYELYQTQTTYNTAGIYPAMLSIQYGNDCRDTVWKNITIFANPVPDFSINQDCFGGVEFSNHSNVPNGVYTWMFGDGTNENNANQLFLHQYPGNGNYLVILTATDAHGCSGQSQLPVVINNSFTPPVKGEIFNVLAMSSSVGNDKWDFEFKFPQFNQCLTYTLKIFDRWGVLVFQVANDWHDPDLTCEDCFRGSTNANAVLSEGTYYYVLEADRGILYKGFLTLFH